MACLDKQAWMMLVTAILLGSAIIDDIRLVSHLSLANAVSHLIINAVMVLYCLSQVSLLYLKERRQIKHFPLFR